MTQITNHNLIKIDEQTEVIREVVSGDYHQKNGSHFLVYQNELSEKVVMKYDDEMLTITRFSSPSTIIKLHPKVATRTAIATPVGQQVFDVTTNSHQALSDGFKTAYQFCQGATKIAQYALEVRFSD